jgi:hypothetical protein
MARRKADDVNPESETPMSSETTTVPNEAAAKPPKKTHVILDYRGMVGRGTVDKGAVRNDRAVAHRLSPLMAFWPENGQADLQLQPGVNVISADLWRFYTRTAKSAAGEPGHPQVMELVKAKQIRELTALPDDSGAVLDLIARSIDPTGLQWIADQERHGDGRPEILDAVADRQAKARPVKLKTIAFQRAVPLVKDTNAPQPSLAMG